MKRVLLLVVVLSCAASLVWAADPPPQQGGTVTVAITADPPGWDPTASTSQEIARVVYHNVYEGLVRLDRNGNIVPALAKSWTVSPDGKTLTFQLRSGVKFHDGTPFTADDVVKTFERAKDKNSGHTHPEYYASIDSIEAGPDDTVVFHLSQPNSSLLFNLARPDSIIYPPSEAATQRSHPVGTGPFKFVSYTPGSEVVLERNPDYYIKGEPYLDKVVFKIMSDPNTRFAALQAGDIDMIASSLPPEQYLQIKKGSVPGVKGTEGTATTEITLALNNARPPLNDKRVREAITMAIDKKAIVQGAMFGLGTVISTHMTPAEPYYIDPHPYPYDPQKAKQLLAEAGYPHGFKIKFELPQPYPIERRTGEVIAQQLKQVGIDAQVSVVEWATWLKRIFLGGDYDMTIIGHSEPRDISIYGNPKYYFHYDNPVVQNLLKQAEAATSPEVQTADYQEVGKIIADDAVNVWVFSPPYLVAAKNDIYGFWTNQPTPAIDMSRVYIAH